MAAASYFVALVNRAALDETVGSSVPPIALPGRSLRVIKTNAETPHQFGVPCLGDLQFRLEIDCLFQRGSHLLGSGNARRWNATFEVV